MDHQYHNEIFPLSLFVDEVLWRGIHYSWNEMTASRCMLTCQHWKQYLKEHIQLAVSRICHPSVIHWIEQHLAEKGYLSHADFTTHIWIRVYCTIMEPSTAEYVWDSGNNVVVDCRRRWPLVFAVSATESRIVAVPKVLLDNLAWFYVNRQYTSLPTGVRLSRHGWRWESQLEPFKDSFESRVAGSLDAYIEYYLGGSRDEPPDDEDLKAFKETMMKAAADWRKNQFVCPAPTCFVRRNVASFSYQKWETSSVGADSWHRYAAVREDCFHVVTELMTRIKRLLYDSYVDDIPRRAFDFENAPKECRVMTNMRYFVDSTGNVRSRGATDEEKCTFDMRGFCSHVAQHDSKMMERIYTLVVEWCNELFTSRAETEIFDNWERTQQFYVAPNYTSVPLVRWYSTDLKMFQMPVCIDVHNDVPGTDVYSVDPRA